MDIKNLIILGTSHISKDSIKEVKKTINEEKPDIICLELDKKRFFALKSGKRGKTSLKDIKHIGLKGYLFMIIGAWAEKKLGKLVGTKPGDEMLAAIKEAEKNKISLAFVDQEIEITLKNMSKAFTWKEKFNLAKEIITAPFKKRKIPFDLRTVPSKEVIKNMVLEVKEKYPSVYKVLISDRNVVIARNVAKLMKKFPDKKLFLIIGAGHEEEVIDMLKRKFE